MKRLTINVTQKHIERGQPADECRCPIALAAREVGLLNVSVGYRLRFSDEAVFRAVVLPEEARRFVTDFDSERAVSPFSFEIEVPE